MAVGVSDSEGLAVAWQDGYSAGSAWRDWEPCFEQNIVAYSGAVWVGSGNIVVD